MKKLLIFAVVILALTVLGSFAADTPQETALVSPDVIEVAEANVTKRQLCPKTVEERMAEFRPGRDMQTAIFMGMLKEGK